MLFSLGLMAAAPPALTQADLNGGFPNILVPEERIGHIVVLCNAFFRIGLISKVQKLAYFQIGSEWNLLPDVWHAKLFSK